MTDKVPVFSVTSQRSLSRLARAIARVPVGFDVVGVSLGVAVGAGEGLGVATGAGVGLGAADGAVEGLGATDEGAVVSAGDGDVTLGAGVGVAAGVAHAPEMSTNVNIVASNHEYFLLPTFLIIFTPH